MRQFDTLSVGAVKLKAWMAKEGKTQDDVAKLADVTQGAVCQWLAGRVPRFAHAAKVAKFVGFDIGDWGVLATPRASRKTKRKAA